MSVIDTDLGTLTSAIALALASTVVVATLIGRAVNIGRPLFSKGGVNALLAPGPANHAVIHACLLLTLIFFLQSAFYVVFYGEPLRTLAGVGAFLGGLMAMSLRTNSLADKPQPTRG